MDKNSEIYRRLELLARDRETTVEKILSAFGKDAVLKEYRGEGVMISLPIPRDVGKTFGQVETPLEELHVTLAYLGRVNELPPGSLKKAAGIVKEVAARWAPLVGKIGGIGIFNPSKSSDDKFVEYATYSSPFLSDLRQEIIDLLRADGVPFKNNHGFIPHITLAYRDNLNDSVTMPVHVDDFAIPSLCLNVGDVVMETPFSGHEEEEVEEHAISETDAGVLAIMGLAKIEKEEPLVDTVNVSAILNEPERRLVYGVVLEPYSVDLQDQILAAEDVEFAAHHFMAVRGIMGYRHRQVAKATVVESFIAPCDFTLGTQAVRKGSWVLVTRVDDEEMWRAIVSGELTGYSVGGFGIRRPLA